MAATDFAGNPSPRSGSIVASIVDKLVALPAAIPYALIALGLRFVIARAFFLAGQAKIEGPIVPFDWLGRDFSFSVVLPAGIKDATFRMFEAQYANLPLPPTLAAYLFTYAEFVLPICLIFGFATRFAALALLVMTGLISVYVMPEAFWTTHVYWIAILIVLLSLGPGAISIDRLIRYVYEK